MSNLSDMLIDESLAKAEVAAANGAQWAQHALEQAGRGQETSTEQPLTTGDAEAADTTDPTSENSGTPEGEQPTDDQVADGDASLNTDAEPEETDGKPKPPETVPYKVFSERNAELQARIEALEAEKEAVRLGYSTADEYKRNDEIAKQHVNPFTQQPFTGIAEWIEVQRAEQSIEQDEAAWKEGRQQARAKLVAERGEIVGNEDADKLDKDAAKDREIEVLRRNLQSLNARQNQTEVGTMLSAFEGEIKDIGVTIPPSMRQNILRSSPRSAAALINDLREMYAPLKEKAAEAKPVSEADAKAKYIAEKQRDKERVGAAPSSRGGLKPPDGQKVDWRAIKGTGLSRILGL